MSHTTYRTHTLGEVSPELVGKKITVCGWVRRHRDLGHLVFLDLWDRYGQLQLSFPSDSKLIEQAKKLKFESTLVATGTLQKKERPNPNIKNGDLELIVDELRVLAPAKPLPFELGSAGDDVSDEVRLERRYLDLRRGPLIDNLALRHQVSLQTRNFLNDHSFLEIQTPILGKSSPEGARDYLVPSRIYPGSFYALPQSPQIFKQLLMVGGCDRYFQIAPCFRDEDLRADRQPEFSQIDIEVSFMDRDVFFDLIENLVVRIFKEVKGKDLNAPFERITYAQAMERFGTDKPDMRFEMELISLDELLGASCTIFEKAVQAGGIIKGLVAPGGAKLSRKDLGHYETLAKELGLGGLAWVKREQEDLSSPLLKFFDEAVCEELKKLLSEGDLLFIAAGPKKAALATLDHVRRAYAKKEGLVPENTFRIAWVVDFPMFEWDPVEERYFAMHHPFTAPLESDIDESPECMRSSGYDLVINGYEVAGGSVRIHSSEMQEKVFHLLGISDAEAKDKFGYLIEALSLGAPPHLGIAFGLERLVMLLAGTDNIRDVIAFPKTTKAADLMMRSPSNVSDTQLSELGLSVKPTK